MRLPLRSRSDSEPTAESGTGEAGIDADSSRLYGFLRGYFRNREGKQLQRHLNQARAGIRYDRYLARSLTRAITIGFLAGALVFAGFLLLAPLSLPERALAAVGLGIVAFASITGGGWLLALYAPRAQVRVRARRINLLLPQAISYLYALSAGGNDITTTMRAVADEEETYGEVAQEFDHVVRDIDYFGADPMTALGNLRDLTPSEELQTFLDDLISTLESGGDIGEFLRAESDKYYDRAQTQQRSFLEQLATLAEVYVGVVVVGPLFLVIVLLLIDLIGADVILFLYLTVYLLIPVLLGAMLLAVYQLARGFGEVKVRPSLRAIEQPPGAEFEDERLARYRNRRRFVAIRSLVTRPGQYIQQRPARVLLLSVPLGIATAAFAVFFDLATPTLDAMTGEPVRTTTALVVGPLLVALTPLSILHERRKRRADQIVDRFPDFLSQLSTANDMGLNVAEALDLVARRAEGSLASEVRKAANDSHWTGDFGEALARMADRIGSAQAARTLTLVQTASRISGNISRVLDVAARDATNAARLRRDRLQEMQTYTAIVAISFLIYLAIILLLEVTFLETFAEFAADLPEEQVGPVQFSAVDADVYRMLLFHSALLQALGNGLVAGKMGQDSLLSGLKYSIILTVLTVGAYVAVVVL